MTERPWVLVLGATSTLARAVACELGLRGFDLVLAARDGEELDYLVTDLGVRTGRRVQGLFLDALAFETHEAFWAKARELGGGAPHGVVLAFGYLGDQATAQRDVAEARRIADTNFTAAVSLLTLAAEDLEAAGEGWVMGFSSVAGDRGRQSNYLYGAAKAGFSTMLEGMRQRLAKVGVTVTTVKPGPIDTKMTFGMEKLPFLAQPEPVARRAVDATLAGKAVVYTPAIWTWIMMVIRWIPGFVYDRLKL